MGARTHTRPRSGATRGPGTPHAACLTARPLTTAERQRRPGGLNGSRATGPPGATRTRWGSAVGLRGPRARAPGPRAEAARTSRPAGRGGGARGPAAGPLRSGRGPETCGQRSNMPTSPWRPFGRWILCPNRELPAPQKSEDDRGTRILPTHAALPSETSLGRLGNSAKHAHLAHFLARLASEPSKTRVRRASLASADSTKYRSKVQNLKCTSERASSPAPGNNAVTHVFRGAATRPRGLLDPLTRLPSECPAR